MERRFRKFGVLLTVALALSLTLSAQYPTRRRTPPASPAMPTAGTGGESRPVTGVDPAMPHPEQGAANTPLRRLVPSAYADRFAAPSGADRPNPRAISNIVAVEPGPIPNEARASAFLWQWGQFLDHDLDLTETGESEPFPIAIPAGDPWFDPRGTGAVVMELQRSVFDPATGTRVFNPRQQLNLITSYIDASNVYGSETERSLVMRRKDGSGALNLSERGMLMFNTPGMPNAGGDDDELFLAGDVRANEQVGLTAMHTLFAREHNRLARLIRSLDPSLDGDEIFARARSLVAAEMQVITYQEFLPLLLGPAALRPYEGFRADVDASVSNLFSTAAYRLGHSMLNDVLLRLDRDGQPISEGHLALAEAFFAPERLKNEGGVEPLLRGFAAQRARRVDPFITDAVRNFLFGPPGSGGFDLAALNIQRGRDHGLPDYNTVRRELGLAPKTSFATISSDVRVQRRLEEAYGSVERIDPWVGGLAEDHLAGALVGELIHVVLVEQFERLRDGDRCWYAAFYDPATAAQLERVRLSDIIRMNTMIGREIPDDVFRAPPHSPY